MMPLQPGPFRLAAPEDFGITDGVYDFTDDALHNQGEVLAVGAGWDGFITDLGNLGAELPDVGTGFDLPGIVNDLDFISGHLPLSYFGDMVQGFFDSQTLLGAATAFAPEQAWTDPGGPFVPPDSALVLVPPTVDPNAFVAAPNITVGGPPVPSDSSVSLYNVGRIGAANFTQGDTFHVYAIGTPGAHLTATGQFNGEQLPLSDYGPLEADGHLQLEGVMGPDNVGTWSQLWYLAGALKAKFDFVVSPADAA